MATIGLGAILASGCSFEQPVQSKEPEPQVVAVHEAVIRDDARVYRENSGFIAKCMVTLDMNGNAEYLEIDRSNYSGLASEAATCSLLRAGDKVQVEQWKGVLGIEFYTWRRIPLKKTL